MVTEDESKSIMAKLCLLAKRMKLHEWTRFNGDDEEALEEEEARIDAGDLRPPTDGRCEA